MYAVPLMLTVSSEERFGTGCVLYDIEFRRCNAKPYETASHSVLRNVGHRKLSRRGLRTIYGSRGEKTRFETGGRFPIIHFATTTPAKLRFTMIQGSDYFCRCSA